MWILEVNRAGGGGWQATLRRIGYDFEELSISCWGIPNGFFRGHRAQIFQDLALGAVSPSHRSDK